MPRGRPKLPTTNEQHPLYRCWLSMRQRCNNPNHEKYHDYGGRGIKVCERWSSFQNFLADMGPKPTDRPAWQYTIERVNNDGHYEPSNCIWATHYAQAQNRRPRKKEYDL